MGAGLMISKGPCAQLATEVEMRCNYCGKFVGHASWCRAPKSTDEIRRLRSMVEALEWLLEVKEVTWADMDAMSMEGFREFQEIRRKALRDAGKEE